MSAHTLKYSEFISAFKNAKSKEEEAATILDAFRAETKIQALVTTGDLNLAEARIETKMEKLSTKMEKMKFDLIRWMIGIIIGGVWIPIGFAVLSKHFSL